MNHPADLHEPPRPDGALTALRAATRERHQRVDRLMDLRRLRERAHYGRVLQVLDAFLGPWEEAVAAALPAAWHPWLWERSRRTFLQGDLQQLGLRPLPPAQLALQLPNAAAAWGSVYVLEGSALGGQVITRALAQTGLQAASSYFHGWGADTQGMWQEFRDHLQAEVTESAWVEAACDAACQTFDNLASLLENHLNERTALA
ncbi:biliverdin-producing heme oxygenase [Ramlibacter sp. G-1-2-2]|uniref:Biliverdin-producing heme oxygenase n=1 Tax=Ramlibacter agri TaxID=2728837 RepID=A0A848HAU8_9BURK|nr:biliverdin-producing heme oxygenase [Ramlibacter agri]NML48156.1 biliverdin-producing heme oxygenase [Ramlibacter agri]